MSAPADLAGDEEHAGVPRCRLQRHRRVEGEVFDSGQAIFPHDRVDCGGGGNRPPRKSAHCHRKMPSRPPERMPKERMARTMTLYTMGFPPSSRQATVPGIMNINPLPQETKTHPTAESRTCNQGTHTTINN